MDEQRGSDLVYLWNVHTYLSDMSKFADTKLAVCAAFASGFLGFLVTNKVPEAVVKSKFAPLQDSALLAILLMLLSICLALYGFFPRTTWNRKGQSREHGLIFWQAIRAHASGADYADYFARSSEHVRRDHLGEQIFTLADIVQTKFHLLKAATLCLLIGSPLAVFYFAGMSLKA